MTLNWSADFVGIPYRDLGRGRDGCDCFGLLRLVYRDVLSIELPSYLGAYMPATERREIAALITDASSVAPWQRVETPAPFDALVFRVGRFGQHIGVHIAAGLMLHVSSGGQSRIERSGSPRWALLLSGIYRHQAMAGR